MSSDQIVKEIVLKYRSEGKDSLGSTLAGQSSRVGGAGSNLDLKALSRQIKEIDGMLAKTGKNFGDGMLKTMGTLKRNMSEIFEKGLQDQIKKAEQSANKIERISRVMDSQRLRGASTAKSESLLRSSYGDFMSSAGNLPEDNVPILPRGNGSGKAPPPSGSGLGDMLGAGRGVMFAQMGAQVLQKYVDLPMQRLQNTTTAASPFLKAKRDVYSGNMEDAVTQYLAQSTTRGMDESRHKTFGDSGVNMYKLGVGAALLATTVASAGTAAPVTVPSMLALAGSGYLMGQGANGLVNDWVGGGIESQKVLNLNKAKEAINNQTLYPELYRNFYGQAQSRYQQQRVTNLSDAQYVSSFGDAAKLGFSGDQTAFFRANLGATGADAISLSNQSMRAANRMNMDIGTANELTAGAAKYGSSPNQSLDQLEKVYTSAFKNAMEQGLIPEFQKFVNSMAASTGVSGDLGAIADRYSKYFGTNSDGKVGALELEQGIKGANAANQIFQSGGTGMGELMKLNQAAAFVKTLGINEDQQAFLYKTIAAADMNDMAGLPEYLKQQGSNIPLTPEATQKFVQDFMTSVQEAHTPGLSKGEAALDMYRRSTGKVDLGAASGMATGMGAGTGPKFLSGTPESQMASNAAQLDDLSSGVATKAQTGGAAKQLQDQYDKIEKNMQGIAAIWEKIAAQAEKTGTDLSDEKLNKLTKALDNFVREINKATTNAHEANVRAGIE